MSNPDLVGAPVEIRFNCLENGTFIREQWVLAIITEATAYSFHAKPFAKKTFPNGDSLVIRPMQGQGEMWRWP